MQQHWDDTIIMALEQHNVADLLLFCREYGTFATLVAVIWGH